VALRIFLSRCAYLMIPLSVLLIKYYPEESADIMTCGRVSRGFVGISTGKKPARDEFCLCAVFRCSGWCSRLRDEKLRPDRKTLFAKYFVLLLMTACG